MSKFKKGDRVRVIDNEGWVALPIGWMGTIHREASMAPGSMPSIVWDKTLPGQTYAGPSGILEKRLEPIPAILTDEELAAKYRQLRKEAYEANDELVSRGYKIATKDGVPISTYYGADCNIFKYVEEDVVVKQQVRKEL